MSSAEKPFLQQRAGECGEFAVAVQVFGDAGHAVEVGADADVIDAAHLHGVHDLSYHVVQGRWRNGGGRLVANSLSMAASRATGSVIFIASMKRGRSSFISGMDAS